MEEVRIIKADEMKKKWIDKTQKLATEFWENCVSKINKDLEANGKAELNIGKASDSRIPEEEIRKLCNKVYNGYKEKGYETEIYFYSETNREKMCSIWVSF